MEQIVPPKRQQVMSSWSSSAEEVVGNEDILVEILLSLPARSIIRFKSVSKQWRFLISEKWFTDKHVWRNPKPSISGLYYGRYGSYPIPLAGHSLPTLRFMNPKPPVFYKVALHIRDSCHGLILCFGWPINSSKSQFIICNPTTRRYKFVLREGRSWGHPREQSYLYFNPSLSPIYKVITIIKEDMTSYYEVCIYTSKCETWKTIHLGAQQSWGRLERHGFSSQNGVIHVITMNHYHVQFNVATEQISGTLMTYEPEREPTCVIRYFGERINGNLVILLSKDKGFDIMVYEMNKQENRHWVLKHNIDLAQQLHKLCHPNRRITCSDLAILHVFWDGETKSMDLTIVSEFDRKCVSYNHKSKETKVICDFPFSNWFTAYLDIFPFIGSLSAV